MMPQVTTMNVVVAPADFQQVEAKKIEEILYCSEIGIDAEDALGW